MLGPKSDSDSEVYSYEIASQVFAETFKSYNSCMELKS